MPGIEYIDLFDEVQKRGYEPVCLSCCDLDYDTFSLMRIQMQEDIYYTHNSVYKRSSRSKMCQPFAYCK